MVNCEARPDYDYHLAESKLKESIHQERDLEVDVIPNSSLENHNRSEWNDIKHLDKIFKKDIHSVWQIWIYITTLVQSLEGAYKDASPTAGGKEYPWTKVPESQEENSNPRLINIRT